MWAAERIDFFKAQIPLFNLFGNVDIEFYPVSQRTQSLILSSPKGHVVPEQHKELTKFVLMLGGYRVYVVPCQCLFSYVCIMIALKFD